MSIFSKIEGSLMNWKQCEINHGIIKVLY